MVMQVERNGNRPDLTRGVEDNPRIVTMLGGAGLTAVDMQMFDRLHQSGQYVAVHGSIMANRITPKSDIDFTIIGNLSDFPPDLKDTLMPGLIAAESLRKIDYISTSIHSQDGRKISMHISEPGFRMGYPDTDAPYATEYRPGRHAKLGDRKYFLPGVDREGTIHLVNFLCKSSSIGNDGSTLTDIPQTGLFTIRGRKVFVDGKEKSDIVADKVISVDSEGIGSEFDDETKEIIVLGLEFDKMQSDTSVYRADPGTEDEFVINPTRRSMEQVGDFTQTDPSAVTSRMFGHLARYWPKMKPGKSR